MNFIDPKPHDRRNFWLCIILIVILMVAAYLEGYYARQDAAAKCDPNEEVLDVSTHECIHIDMIDNENSE